MARPAGQGEVTKKKIVEEAIALFETKGYSATSMSDIKERTTFSKGTIYYHFQNKEELFLYCFKEASSQWMAKCLLECKDAQTATEKLEIVAKCYTEDLQKPITKMIPEFLVVSNNLLAEQQIRATVQAEQDLFKQILTEGIQNGELRATLAIEHTAILFYSMLTGLETTNVLGYSQQQFHDLTKEAVQLFLVAIKNT